jgi:VanZ family protein
MAAIFVVSGQPDPPVPPGISDKLLHGLAYFALAIVAFRAVAGGLPARVTRRLGVAALMITIGYGATDELHQMFVAGRTADVFDLVADAAGGAVGLIACWAWGILGTPKSHLPASNR